MLRKLLSTPFLIISAICLMITACLVWVYDWIAGDDFFSEIFK